MKILVSAIACSPILGSEAYVGWSAVQALSRNHELWVIINNLAKEGAQAAVAKGEVPGNIHFIYHGRSREEFDKTFLSPGHPNRLIARLGNWLNYLEWNNGLLDLARKLHAQVGFDLIHHLTYATWRVGSPLVELSIPFVWGPISGGENMPLRFMSLLSWESCTFEFMRKASDILSARSARVLRTAQRSSHIFAANKETMSRVIRLRGNDLGVSRIAQTFFDEEKIQKFRVKPGTKNFSGALRMFAGGNLEGRKGVAIAVRALYQVHARGIAFDYVYGGFGPERDHLRKLVEKFRLSDLIHLIDSFSGRAYMDQLFSSHLYLLPSLRDGAPVTLMEAMLAGCVPIVLDAGGPGEIVTEDCGFKIRPISPSYVVTQIERIIVGIHEDRTKLNRLSEAASERIRETYSIRRYLTAVESSYVTAFAANVRDAG
jgi:glycosyltransferase involved in cell wall biosynthesis